MEDRCGNVNSCIKNVTVTDCKAPTPICYNGLAISLMPMNGGGMIEIWAEDFNNNSFDNCSATTDLEFSFSSDVTDKNRVYTCPDVGIQIVQMWVTDTHGNQAYCETYVDIQDPDGICPDNKVFASVAGHVMTEYNEPVEEAKVNIESLEMDMYYMTEEEGDYAFNSLEMYEAYNVYPEKNDDPLNGVSTLDLVLIQKHILSFELLDSPYKIIAADIDNNQHVSAIDLVELRKMILGIYDEFPSNNSWRFVDSEFEFVNNENPWPFAEQVSIDDLDNDEMHTDFVGVKIGDVNNTVELNFNSAQTESRSNLNLIAENQEFKAGEEVRLEIKADKPESFIGFQYSFSYNTNVLDFQKLIGGSLDIRDEQMAVSPEGVLNIAWHNLNPKYYDDNDILFELVFVAKERGVLSQAVNSNHSGFSAKAYNAEELEMSLNLKYVESKNGLHVLQNSPNPFTEQTTLAFVLPKSDMTTVTVYNSEGKELFKKSAYYPKGYNEIVLKGENLSVTSGLLYYKVSSGDQEIVKRMLLIE